VTDGPVRDLLEKVRETLERASRKAVSGWLERRTGEVLEMVTGAVAGKDDRRELAGWSAEDVPDLTIRPPEWTVQVEQPRRSWRRAGPGDTEVRDRLGAALAAAVKVFTDRARTAFAEAAREWAGRLDEQAARQMRQAADWFRQCLQTVPSDEDLAAADGLIARFAAFQAALEGAGPPAAEAVIVTPAGSPDAAAEGCTICKQMEQALTSPCSPASSGSPPARTSRNGTHSAAGSARCAPGSTPPSRPRLASPPGTRNWPPRSLMRWSHSAGKTSLPWAWAAALPPSPPSRGGVRCAWCWPAASAPR
jgi:hypothetical protein